MAQYHVEAAKIERNMFRYLVSLLPQVMILLHVISEAQRVYFWDVINICAFILFIHETVRKSVINPSVLKNVGVCSPEIFYCFLLRYTLITGCAECECVLSWRMFRLWYPGSLVSLDEVSRWHRCTFPMLMAPFSLCTLRYWQRNDEMIAIEPPLRDFPILRR